MKKALTQPQLEALHRLKKTGMLGAKAMTKRALRSRELIRWAGDRWEITPEGRDVLRQCRDLVGKQTLV